MLTHSGDFFGRDLIKSQQLLFFIKTNVKFFY